MSSSDINERARELSPIQSTILRIIADAKIEKGNTWVPWDQKVYIEGQWVFVHGVQWTRAIQALYDEGLALPHPSLGAWASDVTDEGLAMAKREAGKPLYGRVAFKELGGER